MTQLRYVGCGLVGIPSFVVRALVVCMLTAGLARSQAPAGFHWVDFKKEAATLSNVEQALKAENYTAIREIGLMNGFALVLTVSRESDQATPEGDQWFVYNVSTKDWVASPLLIGYNLQVKDWITFQTNAMPDIGVVYLDCWECEPASLFTALHYDFHDGWRARWVNEKDMNHPGVPFLVTDVGDPYTNEDVDQVFAVFNPANGVASVGTWYHSKDLSTGKVTDSVVRYSVDVPTGKDNETILTGPSASKWMVQLCKANSSVVLLGGQSSPSCKKALGVQHKSQDGKFRNNK